MIFPAMQKRMKTAIGAGAAVLYGLLAACSNPVLPGAANSDLLQGLATGAMARLEFPPDPPLQPDLAFFDATGAERRLRDWRGRVILVNYWATWCAPCVHEMPTLAALQTARGGADFSVVAISLDAADKAAAAQAFLAPFAEAGLAFHHDPTSRHAFAARARGLPLSVLYDRDGRELARLNAGADWSSTDALAVIDAAITSR